jgi:hypothetical protein
LGDVPWLLRGERVFRAVGSRPEVFLDWMLLCEELSTHPRRAGDEIRDSDATPGTYTAGFDDAVLMYLVLRDYPVVELIQVTWISDFLGLSRG